MHAILLAAGKGSRISKKIPEIPKCTLDVNGIPLVIRTIEMLLKNNIGVTIVVGYKHRVIEELLKDYSVNIVYNPFFDVTNSIGSLWMAKDYLTNEDTIIANADVYWSQDILDQIIDEKNKEVFMLSDKLRADDGDYFFLHKSGIIRKYGKELTRDERNCEYVGIAMIKDTFIKKFKLRLEELVDQQNHGLWWENVLYSYINEMNIYTIDVDGKFWAEIDFIEDYKRILQFTKG